MICSLQALHVFKPMDIYTNVYGVLETCKLFTFLGVQALADLAIQSRIYRKSVWVFRAATVYS